MINMIESSDPYLLLELQWHCSEQRSGALVAVKAGKRHPGF
jgi:hypothetical protein